MTSPANPRFPQGKSAQEIEGGTTFSPRFDTEGLIGAIVTDALSGEVLMFAYMNADALAATMNTRVAHFWSRSRAKLWRKGEESGNTLAVEDLRVDCDQDVLWLKVRVAGQGVTCHTGARSCFYRSVGLGEGSDRQLVLDASQQK
ncbi:MAG: phosphoribosyl-AMP cyclohydrolase [Hyphomicrobiaceae bacterium]|nr:phosphoribosyl-AMP cyclohydrolase [Hyphomicrobiaceae bacterium]